MGLFDFWKKKKEDAPSPEPVSSVFPDEERVWDEAAREDLRDSIRAVIQGEVRLNRSEPAAILETCREVYIEDEAPENERANFVCFASEEIEKAMASHKDEQASWPQETDCDRLDRVEEELRNRGILLWQVSPCCNTCSDAELPDRIEAIDQRYPGFRQTVRGYAFYIDQNLPEMLSEDTEISLYMAYGWFSPDGNPVEREVYEEHALSIAREIQGCLNEHGFETDWNGELSKKLGLSLNWQRRTMLA